ARRRAGRRRRRRGVDRRAVHRPAHLAPAVAPDLAVPRQQGRLRRRRRRPGAARRTRRAGAARRGRRIPDRAAGPGAVGGGWRGLREGTALLVRRAAAVGSLLAPIAPPPEARPYPAPLPLARLKAPADLRAVVAALGAGPVGRAWMAEEVVLFRSKPGRGGSEYTAPARLPLS